MLKPANGIFARLCIALIPCLGFAATAYAQSTDDLQARIEKLERAVHSLQLGTFNGGPAQTSPDDIVVPPDMPTVDLGPILRRMDELDSGIGRLTGQMEELGHRVDLLSEKADRLQKELDLQTAAQNPAAAMPPPTDMPPAKNAAPADTPDTVASLPPEANAPTLKPYMPPGVLGTLPAGQPSAAKGDPKHDFDAAMTLLARAQYDPASQAFRSFADMYPADDRASAALYWTGDIAYSAKKDYDEAARDFAELLKKYPDAARAPEGMLKLGLSLFELGQMKEGCAALAALPAKYPDAAAPVAAQARTARRDNKCR